MATISAVPSLVTIEISTGNGVQHPNVTGILRESSGKRLILTSAHNIPPSTPVTVRTQDRLYLGEVLTSVPEEGAQWTIHVQTRRALMIV